ncbi:MAG: trypsin-like peptidase domain-containing protein [Christensenella sp.]
MNDNKFYDNENNNNETEASAYENNVFHQEEKYLHPDECSEPRRIGENFYGSGQTTGTRKDKQPKKEKSQFITKRFGAVMLSVCMGAAAVFGFGAGMLNGHSTAQAPIVNDTGVMQTSADISNSDTELSVSAIAEKAQNSIVEITTQMVQTNQFMQQVSGEASGSGIIISEDGYIITNNHVVEGGSAFTVRLKSGDSYDAKLIGRDPQMDIAVLKVDATGLTPVTLGDSDELVVGDTTVAIGNPLGTLGGTVTNGIVSATNRELDLGNGTMNLIQTNAAINPGNSGGGLFNGQGELIGVVVAKSGGTNIEGLGFAIPINEAKEVADQLMTNGYVPGRIDLGLTLIDVNSQQAAQMYGLSSTGVYIAKMDADSEAAALGIKSGDRIVSLNNVEIIGAADIDTALENCSVGDKIQITIERSGRTADTELTLQEDVPANS